MMASSLTDVISTCLPRLITKKIIMTETQMSLSEAEVNIVLAERKKIAECRERAEKRITCQHKWSYRGEWRGNSFYECRNCEETKRE